MLILYKEIKIHLILELFITMELITLLLLKDGMDIIFPYGKVQLELILLKLAGYFQLRQHGLNVVTFGHLNYIWSMDTLWFIIQLEINLENYALE